MMDRHFILTHGRSGSNFLANSFNKHPSLVNYGEVLGEWTQPYRLFKLYERTGKGWADYLDTLYSSSAMFYAAQSISAISHLRSGRRNSFKRKASIKSLGIKDFVFLMRNRKLMGYLRDREDIKVIYLTRRNHFSRYLSLLNMRQTGIVKSETSSSNNCQYLVDIEDLIVKIGQYKAEEELGDMLVADIPDSRVSMIDYEEFFSSAHSTEKALSRLFNFLGVEDIKIASSQRKILSSHPSDHITNYEEVAAALKEAGHEKYLV